MVILALLAPALWAATNLIDRGLERALHHVGPLVIVTGLFAGVPGLILLLMGRPVTANVSVLLLAAVTGAVGLAVYVPYLRALRLADPAVVVLQWNLAPVLTAIFAWFVVDERLSFQQCVAILALVVASLVASYQPRPTHLFSRAAPWMFLASCLTALEAVLQKRLYEQVSFLTGFEMISLAILVLTLVLLLLRTTDRRILIHALETGKTKWFIMDETLDVAASAAKGAAISLGPVSVVQAAEGLQPLFVYALESLRGQRPRLSANQGRRLMLAAVLAVVGLAFL